MSFAQGLTSLAMTVCALTSVLAAAEYLLPAGAVKTTMSVGAGILFLAAVTDEIAGIFTGFGV